MAGAAIFVVVVAAVLSFFGLDLHSPKFGPLP
jgi:hypothetical protein